MATILDRLRGRLIVSCQAYPGGAAAVPGDHGAHCPVRRRRRRGRYPRPGPGGHIRLIADSTDVPVTGLWKDGEGPVFITPTLEHAIAVADAGAHVVALDGTRRPRPDGRSLAQTVSGLREHADVLVMADCGSLDNALAAEEAGADIVGTTLAGYTGEREKTAGPDFELIDQLVARCTRPVVVEGRVHTPAQAADAIARGAFAIVVGTAITHPTTMTSWFHTAVTGQ